MADYQSPQPVPKPRPTIWPRDLLRAGAKFVFLPVCSYCHKQAPECKCGEPNKRPL